MQALWMIAASVCFGTMGALIKMVSEFAPLHAIVLFRGLVPVVVLGGWALSKGYSLKTQFPRLHVRRNIAGLCAMWLGFYALTQLPLATATTLNYTSPIFIALILWFNFKRIRNPIDAWLIGAGFIGVLFILKPTLETNQLGAALLGLLGGVCSALAYLQVKSLGKTGEAEWRTVFYFGISAMATGGLWLAIDSPYHQKSWSIDHWTLLVLMGLAGGAGNLALTRAFGQGSTWLSATLQYSTVLIATAYGILLFGNHPEPTTWIGMGLILVCGALSAFTTHSRREHAGRTNRNAEL